MLRTGGEGKRSISKRIAWEGLTEKQCLRRWRRRGREGPIQISEAGTGNEEQKMV